MANKESYEGIELSIDEVVECCHSCPIIKWVPTDKNKKFRWQAGLTIDEIKEHVRSMRKEYYLKTINDLTPGFSGKMYVFKRFIEPKHWCYIKIKINRIKEDRIVVIVSFHESEDL